MKLVLLLFPVDIVADFRNVQTYTPWAWFGGMPAVATVTRDLGGAQMGIMPQPTTENTTNVYMWPLLDEIIGDGVSDGGYI
jgi:hypothetical protein